MIARDHMASNIKCVIFDLDGTLVDAYQAVAGSLNFMLSQLRYDTVDDETIKRSVGWGDRHLVGTFVPDHELDRALALYRRHHAGALKSGTCFLPGAKELLVALKTSGYKLAIASNRPSPFTRIILDHLGVRRMFDYVVCADQVKRPKPETDLLVQILRKFTLKPEDVLYIGDMAIDVLSGQKAGIKTIAVLTGSSTRKEIMVYKPYKVITNISELIKIIKHMEMCGCCSA